MSNYAIRCATFVGAIALASTAWPQSGNEEAARLKQQAEISAIPAFKLLGVGGIEGKTVVGAPYWADQITETTQMLVDGNRIVNTSRSKVYRDQQGRIRVEQTLGNIGGLAAAEPQNIVVIDDPSANAHYTLHADTHTAEKVQTDGDAAVKKEGGVVLKEQFFGMARVKGSPLIPGSEAVAGGILAYKSTAANTERAEEDLGTQTMEGLQVQGRRITTTIPAGQIGNERPIQIVDERWYSPELQMNIMTKHSDPRMGETRFTVANVIRGNPDPALFQVPADYPVTKTQNMFFRYKKTATNP